MTARQESRSALGDAVLAAQDALQRFAEALLDIAERVRRAFAWLEIPGSRKDRAKKEKPARAAMERRERRRRPMTAPPGGHIWIRHERRTRHMARGEVE